MSKVVRRGYVPKDEEEFIGEDIKKVYKASEELLYLINRDYNIKGASTFIGNHYLLSERQRMAIVRAVSTVEAIKNRKSKELVSGLEGTTVNIDGFNTIITLEVGLSNSLLLKCMDGTIRDLAGLRGTYRVVDKSEAAIKLIGSSLEKLKIGKAIFYLDSPVSNSGSLKVKILELLKDCSFEVEVQTIQKVDSTLESLDNVITTDAIILDKCKSWINLNRGIIESEICNSMCIDFEFLSIDKI